MTTFDNQEAMQASHGNISAKPPVEMESCF